MSRINDIASDNDFNQILASNPNILIVIDFYANWCGPCKELGKVLHKWIDEEKKYKDVLFYKLDVDNDINCGGVINYFKITSIPRVVGIKNKVKVFDMAGCDPTKLVSLLDSNK